jgi:hypothetical protein
MDTSVSFPLFVFKKGDYSMFGVETPDKILYHMESTDIENGEYLCWDANGRAVRISISDQRVTGICYGELEIPLAEAFSRYSDVHGLDMDTTGPFDQVWCRLKKTESRLPRSRGLLSRLFRRSRA